MHDEACTHYVSMVENTVIKKTHMDTRSEGKSESKSKSRLDLLKVGWSRLSMLGSGG